jgi:hypothetical protein
LKLRCGSTSEYGHYVKCPPHGTGYTAYLSHTYAATEPDVRFSHRGLIPGEVPALPPLALGAAGASRLRRRR